MKVEAARIKLAEPGHEILTELDGDRMLENIERAGRTCYRSGEKVRLGERVWSSAHGHRWVREPSSYDFARMIIKRGHESVLEHESISVRFVCDRGVSHELVRHRLASFSQESTRYVRYGGGDEEGSEVAFVCPPFWRPDGVDAVDKRWTLWLGSMRQAAATYLALLDMGAKPEEARSVLPNSLRTEIVTTCNVREWRHVMRLRTSEKAHPQMRQLMRPLLKELRARVPVLFDDVGEEG